MLVIDHLITVRKRQYVHIYKLLIDCDPDIVVVTFEHKELAFLKCLSFCLILINRSLEVLVGHVLDQVTESDLVGDDPAASLILLCFSQKRFNQDFFFVSYDTDQVLTDCYFLYIKLFFGCNFHSLLIILPAFWDDLLFTVIIPVLHDTNLIRLTVF